MDFIKKFIGATVLLLVYVNSCFADLAARDPIKWEVTQAFPGEIIVSGGTYLAKVVFTNNLPFTLVKPLFVLKSSNSPSEFTYEDACSGLHLAHLESCTVKIYLDSTSAGEKIVELTESYGSNRVPIPLLQTIASSISGGTGVTGSVTIALPSSLNVGSSADWQLTFTNNGTQTATGLNLDISGDSYTTTCGDELSNVPPNNTCTVDGTYTAASSGEHTIFGTLGYSQGPSISLQTSTNGTGESSGLVCSAAVPLAPQTLINTSNNVTLLCTNKSGSTITIDSHTTSYPSGGAQGTFTVSAGGDNCTAQALPNNASCQLKGVYVSPSSAVSSVSMSLSVNYQTSSTSGLSASTSTTTDVVTQITNKRLINLVNNCDFDVWWSASGGAITDTPSCPSSACPSGSTCNNSANTCYYNNPGPTSGSYYLVKNGGNAATQIVQTDASTVSDQVMWKGVIAASTVCSETTCANNACGNNGGTTSCAPGVGFNQPATQAEFTFLLTASGTVDTYDITLVNGFSIPMSMATNQTAADFTCGTAGNNADAGNLTGCNFSSVTVPTNMYYWVTNTNTSCNSGNTCSNSSQLCGLAFDSSSNSFVRNCGNFLGYYSANQICQTDPNYKSTFGDNFSCAQYLSSPFPDNTYTLTKLLKCSPPDTTAPLFNSCYLAYSGYSTTDLQQCCGCTNWDGIAYVSESCPTNQVDPQWTENVLGIISWMKAACPTAYSYPYDDKASTFQCTASETTEYTITFCPGGGTGLPANIIDGRE